jgi:hypothetical protein
LDPKHRRRLGILRRTILRGDEYNMKDRTPTKPNRVKLTRDNGTSEYVKWERADEPVAEGTPINKATLLTDETAYLLELKKADPTPDDAFSQIAKNFTGDRGMNINLLEEMITMKYCKVIETEQTALNPWLAAGACKCVADSYTGSYRYYARIVADSSVFEVRRVNKSTGEIVDSSIALGAVLNYYRTNSYQTVWYGSIVPVVVRHSDHMIFMYNAGYYYNSAYKSVVGTVCYDTTTGTLISIGTVSTTSSNVTSGYTSWNYTGIYATPGSMLANAVRTDSGVIRFWAGYNSTYTGYVYSMKEGGASFSAYTNYYTGGISDNPYYPYYVVLYKNDYAHITNTGYQYHLQFTDVNAATLLTSFSLSSTTNYSNMYQATGADSNKGGYPRSLTYSNDGLTSYFSFNIRSSPYTICRWTNTSKVAGPTYSVISANTSAATEFWTLSSGTDRRITASGDTLFVDKSTGKYAQSMTFSARPAASNYYNYTTIETTATVLPVVYQMNQSAGYTINTAGDTIIAWNKYGQVFDLKLYEQDDMPLETWTCPEDGTYKVLLVGGGAAGGDSFGGGSGYLMIATVHLLEGATVQYHVGKGGVYNQSVPAAAQVTVFGDLEAMPGNGSKGGADGASTVSGGGGGGYNLVTYGGQGQNYNSAVTAAGAKDRNGGQSANSGACTSGDGYGAGGAYCQDGKDGVIVILR